MKKILIVCFCLLAGVLIYWLWPQYGSGYSEEQRRLWNERRAIFPISWGVNQVSPSREVLTFSGGLEELAGKTANEMKLLLTEKKNREEELSGMLMENRDRSGPDYVAADTLRADVSRLPLCGLSEKEVAERALAGDGDACLKMVQSQFSHKIHGISWRGRHEADKWLDRAVSLKRPGAVFLKNLIAEALVFQKSRIGSNGIEFVGHGMDVKKISGYADFEKCLKKGDYPIYKTFSLIFLSEDMSQEREWVRKALLKGAREGSANCQRDLALLVFEGGTYFSWHSRIKADIRKEKKRWTALLKWLPGSWEKNVMAGLFSCNVIDADRTPAMKEYREAARYARQAARQGDLEGMYLWIRCGITSQERFTPEEWNDVFSYSRLLFESGYFPYLKMLKNEEEGRSGADSLSASILRSYYSSKSYKETVKKSYPMLRDSAARFSPKDSLEKIKEKIQECCLTGQTDVFLKNYWAGQDFEYGVLMRESPEEVRTYLLEQVEKWAAEGDIHAMYALAGVYEKGIGVPADMGRAYALYRKAFEGADDYPSFRVYLKDGDGSANCYEGLPLKQVACLKMGYMVLNHPDFPGRNEKETYDLVLKAADHYLLSRYCCYVLGRFHELGIGRPEDRAVALIHYKRGSRDNRNCRESVERLTTSQEKEKTGNK